MPDIVWAADVRCLECNKKLAEVKYVLGTPVYEGKGGDFAFDNGRTYQTCGKCKTRYQIKRQGNGWALIGEKGSKIFE